MTEALVDTDILSFYFRGDSKVVERFRDYLKEFDQINISIVTYFEILGGLKFKSAEKQIQDFEEFVTNNNIIHISETSAKIAGDIYADLRKRGITIGTSDLLIAGVAIENGLTLVPIKSTMNQFKNCLSKIGGSRVRAITKCIRNVRRHSRLFQTIN